MTPRRLFGKRDPLLLLLGVLFCLLLLFGLRYRPAGLTAVVTGPEGEVCRKELKRLREAEQFTFTGAEGRSVTVEFGPEGARFLSADCPDQICMGTGLLTRAGDAAVCMPARVTLRLLGGGLSDADTY